MSDEAIACKCSGGCRNRRCACHKAGQACGEDCRCKDCANPFNQTIGLSLGDCAREHIARIVAMTDEQKQALVELPCGCGSAPLGQLLGDYECPDCEEIYWFSFCWNHAVQDSCTWHCEICRQCRDWREWHCPRCNRCTYGQSLPCEGCGGRSELAEFMGSNW